MRKLASSNCHLGYYFNGVRIVKMYLHQEGLYQLDYNVAYRSFNHFQNCLVLILYLPLLSLAVLYTQITQYPITH